MLKGTAKFALTMMTVLMAGIAAMGLTADEILDRMEEEADKLTEGSLITTMGFQNTYRDGTTSGNTFGSLSSEDYTLLYYIEPRSVAGTIFLMQEIDDGDDSRMWLYLPLLGIPKELVSDDERGGSFAGSSMSYDDLGGGSEQNDFNTTLIGEAPLAIGDETRTVYVIESIAKEGVDTDTSRSIRWVDTEAFISLKSESYNDLGNLSSIMEVLSLTEFEGRLTAESRLRTDVLDESTTLITISDFHRPISEFSTELFLPENLPEFDPITWGF
jgi:hypothetical protein